MSSKENPGSDRYKFLRGTAMLVIWGGVDDKTTDEDDLNAWWTNEHLPERLAIPGFQRTRRFHALQNGQSQYLVWYEVSSLDTLTSRAYMAALNNPTPATKKFMPWLASMNRSACRVLFSDSRPEFAKSAGGGMGASIAHIVFQAPSSVELREQLRSWIVETVWPTLSHHHSPLALHLLEHDHEATQSGSSTKSYEEVRFQTSKSKNQCRWMILIEFAEPVGAPFAKHRGLTENLVEQMEKFEMRDVETRFYGLICAMNE
ncbi:uncharacterized protein Z518_00794 [Rhinocladiella mackenziei CBS 650.93]|uniref:Uncharacterized protein n=1 Tax=Rhinocladiella mackenziei CBS 650.93 TaxID=1442369 RepID=A0A0D2HGA7_9EURO|nr:uncharacterized protein Z518_00794 [Rhinocladiella mackenziei CBS 650.93]KIX09713.1 hypothetical protein Z518_00794 [Rhinocladiella mackenziei CBS 650.93]